MRTYENEFAINITSLRCEPAGQKPLDSCVKTFISEPQLVLSDNRNMTRRFVTLQVNLDGGWTPTIQLQYDVRIGKRQFVFGAQNFTGSRSKRSNSFVTNLGRRSNPATLQIGKFTALLLPACFAAVAFIFSVFSFWVLLLFF
jgi:hypothetical protein